MPAGPASLHHTGSLPASLPSCSSSQLPVQVEGEKAPCPSWGPAPGREEVECSNFSICAAGASTGVLQGTATQWRSHLLQVRAPQAQSFPSHWQGERGCPTGPRPGGSGVFQAIVIPVSLPPASQHTPSPGPWEETEAFSSSAERQAKDAGEREREPHKLGHLCCDFSFPGVDLSNRLGIEHRRHAGSCARHRKWSWERDRQD